jgi:hypothetical protein
LISWRRAGSTMFSASIAAGLSGIMGEAPPVEVGEKIQLQLGYLL